jgi:hypothetical protein
LHFLDGSLYEDTTVFEQRSVFRLVSDHHTQHGPSFPEPVDALVEAAGKVTLRTDDGKTKSYHLKIPGDVANGMLFTVIKNLPALDSETSVSLVATTSTPRIVKFHIRPSGTQPFSAGGAEREAMHFVGHTDIPGIVGAVAHLMGKQPADADFWIAEGRAPAFVKFRGQLYDGGPLWNVELTSPKLEDRGAEAPSHK